MGCRAPSPPVSADFWTQHAPLNAMKRQRDTEEPMAKPAAHLSQDMGTFQRGVAALAHRWRYAMRSVTQDYSGRPVELGTLHACTIRVGCGFLREQES